MFALRRSVVSLLLATTALAVLAIPAVAQEPTQINYTGPVSSPPGSTFVPSATLHAGGAPVEWRRIWFHLFDESGSLVSDTMGWTDASGRAEGWMTLPHSAGTYSLRAVFDGDETYAASEDEVVFSVRRRSATLTYTGATAAVPYEPFEVSARLLDAETGEPLSGRFVDFLLMRAEEVIAGIGAWTGDDGVASTTVSSGTEAGDYALRANFNGGYDYEPTVIDTPFAMRLRATTLVYLGDVAGVPYEPFTASARLTDAASGEPLVNKRVEFDLHRDEIGVVGSSAWTDENGIASVLLTTGAEPGGYTIRAAFRFDPSLADAGVDTPFDLRLRPTTIAYVGAGSGTPHEPFVAAATLTDDTGAPLAYERIEFEVASNGEPFAGLAVWTDESGFASTQMTMDAPPGDYTISARYMGSLRLASSVDTRSFTLALRASSIVYSGDVSAGRGALAHFEATVTDDAERPVEHGNVEFLLFDEGDEVVLGHSRRTDADGVASVDDVVGLPSGSYRMEVRFTGTASIAPSVHHGTFTVLADATVIDYIGNHRVFRGEIVTLLASLRHAVSGMPLPDLPVRFELREEGKVVAGWNATTDHAGNARIDDVLDVPAGRYAIHAVFDGDETLLPSADEEEMRVDRRSSTIVLDAPATARSGDGVSVAAVVSDGIDGSPLSGVEVTCEILDGANVVLSERATTDESGKAVCAIMLGIAAGDYGVRVAFDGDGRNAGATAASSITVERRPTTLRYTGPSSGTRGATVTLSAALSDDRGAMSGAQVRFTLGSFDAVVTTDPLGVARATVAMSQEPGPYTATVSFAQTGSHETASDARPFEIRWEHTFVDANWLGTVYLNPSTKEFRFATGSQQSGIKRDDDMSVKFAHPGGRFVTVGYGDEEITLNGTFQLDTGRFEAVVVYGGTTYVLGRV